MVNWEEFRRKRSWCNSRYYPSIRLEVLIKIMKNFNQCSPSPGRGLNLGPPEYEAGVLPLYHDVQFYMYEYVCATYKYFHFRQT
jgi:hypothetical protein